MPVGLSKGVKKLVQAKIPNLSKCEDFSDFLKKETVSESEAEDDPASHVTLPQKLSSRGNYANSKSAIRLSELGPRLTLEVGNILLIFLSLSLNIIIGIFKNNIFSY